MKYSEMRTLERRNSIMGAVNAALKSENAYVPPEMLRVVAERLDTKNFYSIVVHRTLGPAGDSLLLTNHSKSHDKSGSEGVEERGAVLVGDVRFGEDRCWQVFDSRGNLEREDTEGMSAEFNVNATFVVSLLRKEWCDRSGCEQYDRISHILVFYAPESIIDEAAYVAAKDAELNRLCRLRGGDDA